MSLTHGSSDDGQWHVEVVEYVGDEQEVHVAAMSRHNQHRILIDQFPQLIGHCNRHCFLQNIAKITLLNEAAASSSVTNINVIKIWAHILVCHDCILKLNFDE